MFDNHCSAGGEERELAIFVCSKLFSGDKCYEYFTSGFYDFFFEW